jgi:hypothetical protein
MPDQDLVERILARCERDHWYGPELRSPQHRRMKGDDPRQRGFAYPPATEAQIQETEAALGVPLPPLLRTLYTRLANGGFGPGVGLRGIIGGYGTPTEPFDEYTTDDTIVGYDIWYKANARLIDLAEYEDQWRPCPKDGRLRLILPFALWPKGWLCLCDLGCVQEMCCDSATGQVYLSESGHDREANEDIHSIHRIGCTLGEWLDAWARDDDLRLYSGSG